MRKKVNKLTTYSRDFKLKAVMMYLDGHYGGYRTIARELNIPDKRPLQLWVKRYRENGIEGLEEQRGKSKSIQKGRPRTNVMSLEEQVIRLQAENEYLKKYLGLERM